MWIHSPNSYVKEKKLKKKLIKEKYSCIQWYVLDDAYDVLQSVIDNSDQTRSDI